MKQVFLSQKIKLKNVRIYLTSRPHMRHELEKSLGVIAYDILPFNFQNQVDYLVQYWSPNVLEVDKLSLTNYAQNCLNEINMSLSDTDKEMAGIPLLCRLIADVCGKKVRFYSTTRTKNVHVPLKIAAMYQQFIEQRIQSITKSEAEIQNITLLQLQVVSQALELLFPADGFHKDKIFTPINTELI